MITDKNNNVIEIGDIVKIENSPCKKDNAVYIVAQDGTSDFYSSSDLSLYKVAKNKNGYSLSRCSYNLCSYPLHSYSNKYSYTREELDKATIEILEKNDPEKIQIKMCADSWENPCEEGKEKDLYYHCTIETTEGKEIEDISFLCYQSEKLQQFLSNVTLKTDETIKIFKACNTDFYYRRSNYEAIHTTETEEPTTENIETVEQEAPTTEAEEITTMKFEANYTIVNEATARTAQTINSFSEYKAGTATAQQKSYTDAIVNYANELLEKNPTTEAEKIEKVQYYIDAYSKKIADAIDRKNRIDASCPSVMICGAGNFPTRKKEKQNSARDKYYEDTKYLYNTDDSNYYFKKIRTTLTDSGIIKSDDKNAVQMIKNKIARLEAEPDTYGNNKAEIRRLNGRLLQLAPDEMKKDIEITINGKEATFENIVAIFNEAIPQKSIFADNENFYLSIPLCFSNGKRKYNEYLSNEVNADCTMLSTYGNRENDYKTIWKPLTDELKFMLIINKISGSGNKAVIYSILKDLLPKTEPQQEETTTTEEAENLPFKTVKNNDLMRLQLLFDGKPSEEIRTILKSNGFRWSPREKAWQRLLNDNALCSLKRVSEAITKIA